MPKRKSPKSYKFCSRSCSAIYNNTKSPKRKRTLKCRTCHMFVRSGYTHCEKCIELGFHIHGGSYLRDRTIGEEVDRLEKSTMPCNLYQNIRAAAKRAVSAVGKKCIKCSYDKHVEVCHVKSISSFAADTKISIINDPSNLVLLCPNCHWEFDNGLLELVVPDGGGSVIKPL